MEEPTLHMFTSYHT